MLNPIYTIVQEFFSTFGLIFILIFALKLMAGAKDPDLTSSIIKPMFKAMVHSARWLLKHIWRIAGEVAQELSKSAPTKYRPILKSATRVALCVILLLSMRLLLPS
jgi:hypothetical protein